MNGKIDIAQAEAIADLIDAGTIADLVFVTTDSALTVEVELAQTISTDGQDTQIWGFRLTMRLIGQSTSMRF